MSLVDEAKRLLVERRDYQPCQFCRGWDEHFPDCPLLAVPRIVAALEAAQKLIDGQMLTCDSGVVVYDDDFRALAAALRGDS